MAADSTTRLELADLSKGQLLLLLELQHACVDAGSDRDSVEELMLLLGRLVPFDAAIASFNTERGACRSGGEYANFGFSDEWLENYRIRNFASVDPVIKHARTTVQAFDYQTAIDRAETMPSQFRSMAEDFGHRYGICCSCNLADDGRSRRHTPFSTVLNLSSRSNRFDDSHVRLLEYVTPHLHEVFSHPGELREVAASVPALTPSEQEVMRWCREGKSSWEIGQITRRSERTVKFHLSNVFTKLGVSTRAHAVAKAMRLELI